MGCEIIQRDQVPPLPDSAIPAAVYLDFKVYDIGLLRWRFKGDELHTFIEYDEAMLARQRAGEPSKGASWKKLYTIDRRPLD
jgi:hypothetical protein